MVREYTIISALGPAGIPMPETFALCTDDAVNERPFYVMSFVEGHILRTADAAERELTAEARASAGASLATTLAQLHAVYPDDVGLGGLARHDGYIERQIRRWQGQFEQMRVEGIDHGELVEEVGATLADRIPDQQRVSIVHGDYRLDNTVLDDYGRVKAILDWEICTLGDPLADIGLLCVYWSEAGAGSFDALDQGRHVGSGVLERRRSWRPTPRRAASTRARSRTTWLSATGSSRASCRASTPATSPAPPQATRARSRTSRGT